MKLIISVILTSFLMFATTSMAKPRKSTEKRAYASKMHQAIYLLTLAKVNKLGEGKLVKLSKAKKELMAAKPNKGGHRVNAISLINKSLNLLKKKKVFKANKLIQKAIIQVQEGAAFAAEKAMKKQREEYKEKKVKRKNNKKVKFIKNKNQPNMKAALSFLKKAKRANKEKRIKLLLKARKSLKKATPNKGGRRVKAIGFINKAIKLLKKKNTIDGESFIYQAIFNTKKGIKYANKH